MAPKALAPALTDDERQELNRLLEKSKLAGDTVSTAADNNGPEKMSMDWATWKPDGGRSSETPVIAYSEPVFYTYWHYCGWQAVEADYEECIEG